MHTKENEKPTVVEVEEPSSHTARRALIGTALAGLAGAVLSTSKPAEAHGDGPLAAATISFGAWMLPMDRHPVPSPFVSHHGLCPTEVTIKAGGCVNFIISGIHQVLIYDDGTLPGDIDTTIRVGPGGAPPPGQLLADPTGRIYRGLDPSLAPRDRVEVVHFALPGTYLVICGVPVHFTDGMFGFIRVLP